MTATRAQLEERIAQAHVDLAEVDVQLAAGELDGATAQTLRDRYRREIESTAAETESLPDENQPHRSTKQPGGLPRTLVGVVVMMAAIAVIVFLAAGAIDNRAPGQFATGNIEGRDLSDIGTTEMEEVVADFPNVVDMRLALARRYFDAGDLSQALPHYLTILEQDPTNAEANANLGWMTFVSDSEQSETAAAFLDRALATAPGYVQATFYLANVRLYGLEDVGGAKQLIEELLQIEDIPDDVAAAIDLMRADAETMS